MNRKRRRTAAKARRGATPAPARASVEAGDTLRKAQALHESGRFEDAAALYERILGRDPRRSDVFHRIGGDAVDKGAYGAGAALIRKAIEANPAVAAQSDDEPPEPGPISRFLGEIKHILTGDDPANLPPPEERAELITGFIGLWMLPDEVHIVTIAVRDSHRRQGIGEMLLIAALDLAREKTQALVTLEVRVSNDAAIRLYEKYGFEQVGRRPRYYSDNHDDAYILTANSVTTSDYAERLATLREEHRARYGEFDVLGAG
ncbi:MAG: ribosomal protein S18-alanine N-acetyltransferase [Chloroflexi bacterium]|nr:ribosomal protein S18-alanine N-acetyltransferase [Chloroflexota bacterium]